MKSLFHKDVSENCKNPRLHITEGRGPAKRKVKPVEPQSLLDFDLGEGESSDDSDFRIEDHPEESDDYSINSDDDDKSKHCAKLYSVIVYLHKENTSQIYIQFFFFFKRLIYEPYKLF